VSRFCVNSAEAWGGRCRRNQVRATSTATMAALPMAAFLCRLMMLAIMTESDTGAGGGRRTGSAAAGEDAGASDRLELVSRFSSPCLNRPFFGLAVRPASGLVIGKNRGRVVESAPTPTRKGLERFL
jgi:hypothetical protein